MPAREMLADMLLETEAAPPKPSRNTEAAPEEFAESVRCAVWSRDTPRNWQAMPRPANAYYTKLMEISAPSADRAELKEARTYLATASKNQVNKLPIALIALALLVVKASGADAGR